jgi:hypothetical protein
VKIKRAAACREIPFRNYGKKYALETAQNADSTFCFGTVSNLPRRPADRTPNQKLATPWHTLDPSDKLDGK